MSHELAEVWGTRSTRAKLLLKPYGSLMPFPGTATPDSKKIEVRSMLCCEFSTRTPLPPRTELATSSPTGLWCYHSRGVTTLLSQIRKLRLSKGWNPTLGLTARGWLSGFEPKSRHRQCQVCWLESNVFYSSLLVQS